MTRKDKDKEGKKDNNEALKVTEQPVPIKCLISFAGQGEGGDRSLQVVKYLVRDRF